MNRRFMLQSTALFAASMVTRRARAQASVVDTSNYFIMNQSAALPVRLPPKPVAGPSLTPDDVNALERELRCQCGCTLDVYTCRTTDLVCQVAPAMHRDVSTLAAGGYTSDEILSAFAEVYGDRVLMAPPARGFNRLAYALPWLGVVTGAVVLTFALRRRAQEAG